MKDAENRYKFTVIPKEGKDPGFWVRRHDTKENVTKTIALLNSEKEALDYIQQCEMRLSVEESLQNTFIKTQEIPF